MRTHLLGGLGAIALLPSQVAPIRRHLDERVRLPLDRGAAGRAFLAYDGATGEPYDTIRQNGRYASIGGRDPKIAAVSVPVVDVIGYVRGALPASAPLSRFDSEAREGALKALRGCAERLKTSLSRDWAGVSAVSHHAECVNHGLTHSAWWDKREATDAAPLA